MPVGERQPVGLHLAWLLSIMISGAFVTVLIIVSGDLATFWPLYLVPIVLASLAYHAPGSIVSVAVCGALVVLLTYGAGYDAPSAQALVVGGFAFAVSGLVVGVQARRYQQQRLRLEHDTTRDEVTGAYGADYFSDRLSEEVRRCARYDESVTLVLVRPADFADFLRVYGRVKGDLLLQRYAEVLQLAVRDTDLVGRLETELFSVIMPSTTAEEARLVAERLITVVRETEFEGDALEPVVHCAAELAAASYPDDAIDSPEMLNVALERLGVSAPRGMGQADAATRSSAPSLGDVPS